MEHQVSEMTHPLIQYKLTSLRDENTGSGEFRSSTGEITMLMCCKVTRDLPLEETQVETPVVMVTTKALSGRKLALMSILRAGLGTVDAVLELIPAAKVSHIGLYRDHETLQPAEYYSRLPQDTNERDVIVLSPMLTIGSSAVDTINTIKRSHPKSIEFTCIIAVPEGIEALSKAHPDMPVYCTYIGDYLSESDYIVPDLNDAGDWIFGTL